MTPAFGYNPDSVRVACLRGPVQDGQFRSSWFTRQTCSCGHRIIPYPKGAKDDLIRIVDESGEDYLYHKSHFVFVDFPRAIAKKILSLRNAAA